MAQTCVSPCPPLAVLWPVLPGSLARCPVLFFFHSSAQQHLIGPVCARGVHLGAAECKASPRRGLCVQICTTAPGGASMHARQLNLRLHARQLNLRFADFARRPVFFMMPWPRPSPGSVTAAAARRTIARDVAEWLVNVEDIGGCYASVVVPASMTFSVLTDMAIVVCAGDRPCALPACWRF